MEAYDGSFFKANEIKSCDPNKFALQFIRKLKGPDYLAHHLCEPKQPTTATASIAPAVICLLKGKCGLTPVSFLRNKKHSSFISGHLSSRFEKYSWGSVRDSLNMAGRDRRKVLKRSTQAETVCNLLYIFLPLWIYVSILFQETSTWRYRGRRRSVPRLDNFLTLHLYIEKWIKIYSLSAVSFIRASIRRWKFRCEIRYYRVNSKSAIMGHYST